MAPSQYSERTATEVLGQGIRVDYRGRTVLQVHEIRLPAGKTYALLGASGAGKSTLLRVLGLLEKPSAGTIMHDGAATARNDLTARRRISAVFQKPYLLRGTVAENVGYGLKLRGVGGAERKQRVADALDLVGLGGWEGRSALQMSGGEAQRVALARALVLQPNLLLLDEPLSYLDPLLKRDLTQEFAQILGSEHITALYVTHDQDEAAVVADVLGVMRDGQVVAEGDPRTVLTLSADPWAASFLGTELPIEGTVISVENGGVLIRSTAGVEVLAASDAPIGSRVRFGVRPEDVLLFESDVAAPGSADQNLLPARVVEVVPTGVTIRVVLESSGHRFAAQVSRPIAGALHLAPGIDVAMLFKSASVWAEQLDEAPE